MVAALRGRGPVIAFERPGYDGHSAPGGLEYNAAAALAQLDRVGASRATVVGHSYGGAVAAWLAARHPERVSTLVLVAAAANSDSLTPIDHVLAAPYLGPLVNTVLLGGGGLLSYVGALRRFAERRYELPDDYVRASGRLLRRRATHRTFTLEQRMLLHEIPQLERMLPGITAKTTVIAAGADRIVPPAAGRRLAQQIPQAWLTEIESAGHLLLWSHAGQVAQLIGEAAGTPIVTTED